MVSIRRNRNKYAQLPHPVRLQAEPIRSPNDDGSSFMFQTQRSTVLSHTDVQIHKEINQYYGTHHKLDSAEESGGAVMLGKPVLQHASEEQSSLQDHHMEDMHKDSEPDQNDLGSAGKERMLQFGNQHEETAAAGKQVILPAHQKDPKGPQGSPKFHGVSFDPPYKLWEAFVWDPTKNHGDPRKNPGGKCYLGRYDSEEKAAQIHDKAVIKLGRHKGPEGTRTCPLNFPLSTYASDIEEMKERGSESAEEYFRRLNASYAVGFVQGKVDMRGVSLKAKSGKYVARFSYKDSNTKSQRRTYLGLFEDIVEAGKCYDKAAIFYKREATYTNFPPNSYTKDEIEAYGCQLKAKLHKVRG